VGRIDGGTTRSGQLLAGLIERTGGLLDQADSFVQAISQNGHTRQDRAQLIMVACPNDLRKIAARHRGDEALGLTRLSGDAHQQNGSQQNAQDDGTHSQHQTAPGGAVRFGFQIRTQLRQGLVEPLDLVEHQLPHLAPLGGFFLVENHLGLVTLAGLDDLEDAIVQFLLLGTNANNALRQVGLEVFRIVVAHLRGSLVETVRGILVVVVGLGVFRVEHDVARRLPHLQALCIHVVKANAACPILLNVARVGILDLS